MALCQSVISQQISTRAAASISDKFRALYPRSKPTPAQTLLLSPETLRTAGLTRQKQAYIVGIAQAFADGSIPVRRFGRMDDEAVIESLTALKGVGRWTAEMFLMFVLNRPDVLPVDDLGLAMGVKRAYGLPDKPDKTQLTEIGEPWRPWRSIATWYIWRGVKGD